MGADLLLVDGQTDRRTDMTTLIVPFRSSAEAPNICTVCQQSVLFTS